MTPELKKFIVDRAMGNPTESLDSISEELFHMYMNDLNSSTLREIITILVAGYEPLSKKLGRDGFDPNTGRYKEVKPKLYTFKTTNGAGCFNDYTRKRLDRDVAENLDIVQSFFIKDRLAYLVEYSIIALKTKLEHQIKVNCEEKQYRYVRSASWSYCEWIAHESTKLHYINWDLINSAPKCMNKKMYAGLRALDIK